MVNRHLNDLLEVFSNSQDVKDNPLIYSFDNVIPADNSEELLYGITVIQPGDINGEFYAVQVALYINNDTLQVIIKHRESLVFIKENWIPYFIFPLGPIKCFL